MLVDAALINFAVFLALYLRFNTAHLPAADLNPYLAVAPLFTILTILLFWITRLYHRLWRYAGVRDAQVVIFSVVGSALVLGILLFSTRTTNYARAIYVLYALLAVALVGGWRFLIHSFYNVHWNSTRPQQDRILIVGAGKAGQLVAQELHRHPEVGVAVGFLDDALQKAGMRIASLKVVGRTENLPQVVRDLYIDQVLLAIPSASGAVIRPLVDKCRDLDVKVRIVPGLTQMINGRVLVDQIRDVKIDDLLQREPFRVDMAEIAGYLTNRVVMVTGAGGTIGAELARQIAVYAPARLLLVGLDETDIFAIDWEMREHFPNVWTCPIVADLRDGARLERIFAEHHPQVVFHAAAHKHVALMETQVDEAIYNNVAALWQIVDQSYRSGVETFVFISSDKAVNPVGVYGATKRVGELLISAYATRAKTRFLTVRFGNVLGSRGSVVPIFQEQIRNGGTDHDYPPRDEALLHDGHRSVPTRCAGGFHGAWRRNFCAGHGTTHAYCRLGNEFNPAVGPYFWSGY